MQNRSNHSQNSIHNIYSYCCCNVVYRYVCCSNIHDWQAIFDFLTPYWIQHRLFNTIRKSNWHLHIIPVSESALLKHSRCVYFHSQENSIALVHFRKHKTINNWTKRRTETASVMKVMAASGEQCEFSMPINVLIVFQHDFLLSTLLPILGFIDFN